MRFDTVTGVVNINTFIPPETAVLGRTNLLESTYPAFSGDDMDMNTASDLSFSYLGYVDTASSVSIDFDTRQDGTPYVGLGEFFPAAEYDGVVINDSDPAAGSTFVNLVFGNVGADISGYHVNIGAFAVTPQTQLTLDFTTVVTAVSFDFADPGGDLTVTAFDASATQLGVINFNGTDLFTTQTGTAIGAGHVDISGIGEIASLLIEPNPSTVLIIDNLSFTTAVSP